MVKTPATWLRNYDDVDPIKIHDPVAAVLGVVPDGEPFTIGYPDVVKLAGHSCPAASGAFRITEQGLDALYPEEYPVRSQIAVRAGGPRGSHPIGVIAGIISSITGAAEEDGFGGLGDGYGDRKHLLTFAEDGGDGVEFAFERLDTNEAVSVTYHLDEVPSPGPGFGHLPKIIAGDASSEQRDEFETAWHDRVEAVLTDDGLFTVDSTDPFHE